MVGIRGIDSSYRPRQDIIDDDDDVDEGNVNVEKKDEESRMDDEDHEDEYVDNVVDDGEKDQEEDDDDDQHRTVPSRNGSRNSIIDPEDVMIHELILCRRSNRHKKNNNDGEDDDEEEDEDSKSTTDDEDRFEVVQGENWLRLVRKESFAVWDQTQDFTASSQKTTTSQDSNRSNDKRKDDEEIRDEFYPSILSLTNLGGGCSIIEDAPTDDCYVCLDVDGSLLAVKDMRPWPSTAITRATTQATKAEEEVQQQDPLDADHDPPETQGITTTRTTTMGILCRGKGRWDVLPRRQIKLLQPGDRLCTSLVVNHLPEHKRSEQTRAVATVLDTGNKAEGLVLEYRYTPRATAVVASSSLSVATNCTAETDHTQQQHYDSVAYGQNTQQSEILFSQTTQQTLSPSQLHSQDEREARSNIKQRHSPNHVDKTTEGQFVCTELEQENLTPDSLQHMSCTQQAVDDDDNDDGDDDDDSQDSDRTIELDLKPEVHVEEVNVDVVPTRKGTSENASNTQPGETSRTCDNEINEETMNDEVIIKDSAAMDSSRRCDNDDNVKTNKSRRQGDHDPESEQWRQKQSLAVEERAANDKILAVGIAAEHNGNPLAKDHVDLQTAKDETAPRLSTQPIDDESDDETVVCQEDNVTVQNYGSMDEADNLMGVLQDPCQEKENVTTKRTDEVKISANASTHLKKSSSNSEYAVEDESAMKQRRFDPEEASTRKRLHRMKAFDSTAEGIGRHAQFQFSPTLLQDTQDPPSQISFLDDVGEDHSVNLLASDPLEPPRDDVVVADTNVDIDSSLKDHNDKTIGCTGNLDGQRLELLVQSKPDTLNHENAAADEAPTGKSIARNDKTSYLFGSAATENDISSLERIVDPSIVALRDATVSGTHEGIQSESTTTTTPPIDEDALSHSRSSQLIGPPSETRNDPSPSLIRETGESILDSHGMGSSSELVGCMTRTEAMIDCTNNDFTDGVAPENSSPLNMRKRQSLQAPVRKSKRRKSLPQEETVEDLVEPIASKKKSRSFAVGSYDSGKYDVELVDERYRKRFMEAISEKTVRILTSTLTDADESLLKTLCLGTLAENVKIRTTETVGKKTTLCIMSVDDEYTDNIRARSRTIKAMRCALAGIPIVGPGWLQACKAKGAAVTPTNFVRTLPTKMARIANLPEARFGVAKIAAAWEIQQPTPELPFSDMFVFLLGNFEADKRTSFSQLLRDGGAKIVSGTSELSSKLNSIAKSEMVPHRLVILCGDCGLQIPKAVEKHLNEVLEKKIKGVIVVDSMWVVESVTCARSMPANYFKPKEKTGFEGLLSK